MRAERYDAREKFIFIHFYAIQFHFYTLLLRIKASNAKKCSAHVDFSIHFSVSGRAHYVQHDRLATGARITGDFRAMGSILDYHGARGNAAIVANITRAMLVDNALGRIKANSGNPIANSSTYASLMTVIERNL